MDLIKNISAILALIAVVFSAYFYLDNNYALKSEVMAAEQKVVGVLDKFKTDLAKDRLEQNYINILNLERQYKALVVQHPNDKNMKDDLQEIVKDKENIKKKLDELRGLK